VLKSGRYDDYQGCWLDWFPALEAATTHVLVPALVGERMLETVSELDCELVEWAEDRAAAVDATQ
jgi:hypothetical protein